MLPLKSLAMPDKSEIIPDKSVTPSKGLITSCLLASSCSISRIKFFFSLRALFALLPAPIAPIAGPATVATPPIIAAVINVIVKLF